MSTPARSPRPPDRRPGGPLRPRRAGILAATAAALFAADQVSKVLVVAQLLGRPPVRLLGGALYLTHARNPGAAFGFAEGATVLFTLVAAVVVAVIVRSASRLRSRSWALCLGLILGGAGGNLVDRLLRAPGPLRGHVVDWISVFDPYGRVWPIFNVADSGIVVGGILAVVLAGLGIEVDGTRSRRSAPDPAEPSPPPTPPGGTYGPGGSPVPPGGPHRVPPGQQGLGPHGAPAAGPHRVPPAPPGRESHGAASTGPGQTHPGSGWHRPAGRPGPQPAAGNGAAGGYVPSSGPLAGPHPAPPEQAGGSQR